MIDVRTKDDCTGCGACAEHCPRRCISFVTDDTGWRRPVVNTDFCLGCGMCDNVCPVIVRRAIATGNFFLVRDEEEIVAPPREEEPDMRGLLFDTPAIKVFRPGDCILSLYGPNDKGRLLKVCDGASALDKGR